MREKKSVMSISAIDIRMKEQYEDRFRFMLPRRGYTIIRVDGRAFHTWTRGLEKPYDRDLMAVIDIVALELCDGHKISCSGSDRGGQSADLGTLQPGESKTFRIEIPVK